MNIRRPLAQKSLNSNIDQSLNFSFDKTTQKKPLKAETTHIDSSAFKKPLKQKQMIDMFLGELKEHNHEKMIQMFGELRRQNKEKEERNGLLVGELEGLEREFKEVKLEYGRCLKERSRVEEQLNEVTRQMSIYQTKCESQQRQMKQLLKRQQQSTYYKSQLFEANQKLAQYKRRFVQPDQTVQNQREFRYKQMQWTYEMKLDECEEHIKELERENWELGQGKIRQETQVKRLGIELEEARREVGRLLGKEMQGGGSYSNSYLSTNSTKKSSYNHYQPNSDSSSLEQQIQSLQCQIQTIQHQLQTTTQAYQLRIVQLESQLELQKFKTQTYSQHTQTLQDKLNLIQNDITLLKKQNLQLQENHQTHSNKLLDLDTFVKQIIIKLKDFANDNILIADYLIILNHKYHRITGGKPVTFLKNNTKDFVSITSRTNKQSDFGPHSLTSKLNQELKLLKTQKRTTTFQSDSESSYRESFKSNYTSIKKNQEKESVMSRNSDLLEMQEGSSAGNKEKFDSKILEERREIENRIREKYMKSRENPNGSWKGKENGNGKQMSVKGIDKMSMVRDNLMSQDLKELSFEEEGERSPDFRREDRVSIYLTSEFQQ